MPLGKNIQTNIKELYKDNTLSGKARGANGKPRGKAQIIAIAYAAAKKAGAKVKVTAKKKNGKSKSRKSN